MRFETISIAVGVCAGRHEMPVDKFVFDKIADPTDVKALEATAWEWYRSNVLPLTEDGYNVDINIYVTGLTVATMSIVDVVLRNHFWAIDNDYPTIVGNGTVKLWHFDAVGQKYYSQDIGLVRPLR